MIIPGATTSTNSSTLRPNQPLEQASLLPLQLLKSHQPLEQASVLPLQLLKSQPHHSGHHLLGTELALALAIFSMKYLNYEMF